MTESLAIALLWQHCVQITFLAAVIFGMNAIFFRSRPSVAYLLWMLVLLKCVTPPLGASAFSLWNLLPNHVTVESDDRPELRSPLVDNAIPDPTAVPTTAGRSDARVATTSSAVAPSAWRLGPISLILWLAGALGVILTALRSSRRVDLLVQRRPRESGTSIARIVDELAAELQLRRAPDCIVVDEAVGPAVRGILRPQLLIPRTLLESIPEQQLRLVVLHELMHLRRRDLLAGWFQAMVQVLWWFHPVVWLAGRMCSHERERCCDEDVLRHSGVRSMAYAQCLLNAVQLCQARTWTPGIVGFSGHNALRRRLRHIMRCTRTKTPRWLVMGVVVPAALLILTGAKPASQKETSADKTDSQAEGNATDDAFPPPRIIAMTWQKGEDASGRFSDIPFWTPDGELLSENDAQAIKNEIRGTEVSRMSQPESRPLVFIFDVGTRLPPLSMGVKVNCRLPDGHETRGGTFVNRSAGRQTPTRIFAVSAATRFLRAGDQFQWPQSADIVLTFPIETPELIDTRTTIPTEPVVIADGVRWMVEPDAGYDPRQQGPASRYPAAVLETLHDESPELINYFVRVYEKGSDRALPDAFTTIRERDGKRYRIEVSDRFPEPEQLDRIEFYRQRWARAVVPDVRIRTDLLAKTAD